MVLIKYVSNKDFKYLESATKEYTIKSNEVKYGEYSNYQKKRLDNKNLDEDIKKVYYYQDLKRKADNIGKVRNGLKRVKYLFQK